MAGQAQSQVDTVPDPVIEKPTDAVIEVTTTNICGSDLHLYEVLGAFMDPGDILGHEPIGIVAEVGREVSNLKPGDRVVIPFQIACGHCCMCQHGLPTQCDTTRVREQDTGAALFGYSKLYGQVPGRRRNTCGFPRRNTPTSKFLRARRIRASSICPMCCRPQCRRLTTRRYPTAGR